MTTSNCLRSWLSDPARLGALTQAIRAKVPPSDVEDVVQSTLADALTAAEPPTEAEAFDRWVFGIARHKIADYYRRNRRHPMVDGAEVDSDAVANCTHTEPNPESARDLLRWVGEKLPKEPEATRTLEWMMREASGDKLETIAREQELSAPAVRQRVSRLRRYLREHWAMELAAALGLLIVVTGIFEYRQHQTLPPIGPELVRVAPTPAEQAIKLREAALAACRAGEWKPCITELDQAKELDPSGDSALEVREARIGAARALNPAPAPTPSMLPTPSTPPVQTAAPVSSTVPTLPTTAALSAQGNKKPVAPKSPASKKSTKSDFESNQKSNSSKPSAFEQKLNMN